MKKIAIFGISNKKHEKRIPLHPKIFNLIPKKIKKQLYFEDNYANNLGVSNTLLKNEFGGVLSRKNLFKECDIWVLPKPEEIDFKYFAKGKILWGWPHCVQGHKITQAAIDSKMTIIAWEAMYGGNDNCHVFYRNNELAGYAAIQHMMMLVGRNGHFGGTLKAAVLGFGASARGAISSLKSLGIDNITVYSKRPSYLINGPIQSVNYKRIKTSNNQCFLEDDTGFNNPAGVLTSYDIIANCILQDPTHPITFIQENELNSFKKQLDIVDISCDQNMGFFFAKPTTFETPILKPSQYINYYSIDHTPTLYWDSASFEISKSIIDYLPFLINDNWNENKTLNNACEIKNGIILNKKIIEFQNRKNEFPYNYK